MKRQRCCDCCGGTVRAVRKDRPSASSSGSPATSDMSGGSMRPETESPAEVGERPASSTSDTSTRSPGSDRSTDGEAECTVEARSMRRALWPRRSWPARPSTGPGRSRSSGRSARKRSSPGARHLAGRRGPDAVIAGEPSRWDGITIGYKGDLRLTARFRGQRSHYSSPHPTVADTALRWVESVRALPMMMPGTSPFRSLTLKVVGVTTGGDDAEWALVTLDLRIPPGRTTAEVLRALPSEPGPSPRPTVRPDRADRGEPDQSGHSRPRAGGPGRGGAPHPMAEVGNLGPQPGRPRLAGSRCGIRSGRPASGPHRARMGLGARTRSFGPYPACGGRSTRA